MSSIAFVPAYRLGLRFDGTALCWGDQRRELDAQDVYDLCIAIEDAITHRKPATGAGFRVIPARLTLTIVGHGIGPAVLASKDEALRLGIRLMIAARRCGIARTASELPGAEPRHGA